MYEGEGDCDPWLAGVASLSALSSVQKAAASAPAPAKPPWSLCCGWVMARLWPSLKHLSFGVVSVCEEDVCRFPANLVFLLAGLT